MIPTFDLVGIMLGLAVHDRGSLARSLAVGAALAAIFGIVFVRPFELSSAVLGAILAATNVAVGMIFGGGVRWAFGRLHTHGP